MFKNRLFKTDLQFSVHSGLSIIKLLPDVIKSNIHNEQYLAGLLDAGYDTPDRQYHNLRHIHYMLLAADEIKDHIENYENMCLAILGHDIVYQIGAYPGTNEYDSAYFFDMTLNRWYSQCRPMIFDLIIATTHGDIEPIRINDEKIIHDLDLAHFEWEYSTFAYTGDLVQWEYEGFYQCGEEKVKKGRMKFLRSMLKKKRIYETDLFSEDIARDNIKKEIQRIKNELAEQI